MTSKELGELFPVIIQDYSEKWPGFYDIEKTLILSSFIPQEIATIDHIGSTAIPGLKVKPTIDILMQVSKPIDLQNLELVLQSLGYQHTAQPDGGG